jgi:hypothetical protein
VSIPLERRRAVTRAAALSAALFLCVGPARADVSSWLFTGVGPSLRDRPGLSSDVATSLQIDSGLGSSPKAAVAVGGLLRLQTRFAEGTDLGLFVRTATGGYVRGAWGAALDLGGFVHPWGTSTEGYAGTLSLGAPWGITLDLDAARDANDARKWSAVLGIDFARFSIYRSTGLSWLPNPFPSPQ